MDGAKRRIREAKFDVLKGLDTFGFQGMTLPRAMTMEQLKSLSFIQEKENLILYGPPGTGKTHLATALGVEACKKGYRVMYVKTSRFVNEMVLSKDKAEQEKFWRKFSKMDLLILDEWGYIPFERVGTQMLFEAVSGCYEKRSIILTTNLPFNEWRHFL